MRPIDADALKKRVKESTAILSVKVLAATLVNTAPTIDAVPVVRCKGCKHFRPCEEVDGETWLGWCAYGEFNTDDLDFCSRGERKDNGEA